MFILGICVAGIYFHGALPMSVHNSVIAELESAIKSGSQERRVETLRRNSDLFLIGADRNDDAQIAMFDDVLGRLIKRIESKALVELSMRLAPVDNAPVEVIRQLARHDEMAVAGPILTQSARLTADDLVEIAGTKSQQHLLAISGRDRLEESVTDVLVERGDRKVRHTLAKNDGARFSETGFTALVRSAETDEGLAEKIGSRLDIPSRALEDLLSKATEAVRSRLMAAARPETKDTIARVLNDISNRISREVMAPRDFTRARQLVRSMHERGELDESALIEFAASRKYEEMVVALSALCSASIDLIAPLMRSRRNDGVLVPCRAAGLKWLTVNAILSARFTDYVISDHELAEARDEYQRLSQSSAQRTVRFWQVRVGTKREDA